MLASTNAVRRNAMSIRDVVVLAGLVALGAGGACTSEPEPSAESAVEAAARLEARAKQAEAQQRAAAARLMKLDEEMRDLKGAIDRLVEDKERAAAALLAAETKADKAKLQAELDTIDAELEGKKGELEALRKGARGGTSAGAGTECQPNDPLCGL